MHKTDNINTFHNTRGGLRRKSSAHEGMCYVTNVMYLCVNFPRLGEFTAAICDTVRAYVWVCGRSSVVSLRPEDKKIPLKTWVQKWAGNPLGNYYGIIFGATSPQTQSNLGDSRPHFYTFLEEYAHQAIRYLYAQRLPATHSRDTVNLPFV